MKLFSTGLLVLALLACDKDDKKSDKGKISDNPAPALPTEVTPAPTPTPTSQPKPSASAKAYEGTWKVCQTFEQDDTIEGLNFPLVSESSVYQFKSDGSLAKTITLHTDKSCTKQVSESDLKAYIKRLKDLTGIDLENPEEFLTLAQPMAFQAKYEIVADLGQGQFQYNTVLSEEERSYSTLKVNGETLTLAYECNQDDVDEGICEKLTGNTPENRATIDARAVNLSRVK